MNILTIQHIFIYGGLLSVAMGALIFGSLYYNARLWLQDYPAEVRAKVPPLTPAEKRDQRVLMIPFLLIMVGVPFYATHLLRVENGGAIPFLIAYLSTFLVLNVFNLFDAVIIDLVVLTFMTPAFAVIPGAEGMEHLNRDWNAHWKNYLKGIVFAAVFSLPITLAAMVW
jgi:K+ transporter